MVKMKTITIIFFLYLLLPSAAFPFENYNDDGLINKIINNLRINMFDEIIELHGIEGIRYYYLTDGSMNSILNDIDVVLFDNEFREREYIKKRIALTAVTKSIVDYLDGSLIYEKFEFVDRFISNLFCIRYSVLKSSNEGKFYLPGQKKQVGESLCDILLTSSMYSISDDGLEKISIKLKVDLSQIKTTTIYDIKDKKYKFIIKNNEMFNGWNFIIENNNEETMYILKLLKNY